MIKFTIKSLITIAVTSSALLLTPLKSSAQVNMKMLTQVAKSCQEDVISDEYYQKMGIYFSAFMKTFTNRVSSEKGEKEILDKCVEKRYHYSLVVSKLPWLSSSGEILPGYLSSVAVAGLSEWRSLNLLDCIITQNASSKECSIVTLPGIYRSDKVKDQLSLSQQHYYPFYICPSCVIAHDNTLSKEKILDGFIQWFLTLKKPQRKELFVSLLGDEAELRKLRHEMKRESELAQREYQEARQRVEQQEKERRRQELLED